MTPPRSAGPTPLRSPGPRLVRSLATALVVLVLVGLGGCLPATGDRPTLLSLNAPAETQVIDLAGAFEGRLPFSENELATVPGTVARFRELRTGLRGSQALPGARSVARNLGADAVLLVYAPVYERTVEIDGERRTVTTQVRVAAQLVPLEGAPFDPVESAVYSAERVESTDVELPSPREDPDLVALRERALDDLVAAVAAQLREVLGLP